MYPSIDDDDDFLASLCFDQSNGAEDPYAFIQTNEDNIFPDFGSSGVNLQPQQEQACNVGVQFESFSRNLQQVVYSSSIGSTQLDLGASYSGVLQQEPRQVCSFRRHNNDSAIHCGGNVQQGLEQLCNDVVEINSSSSVGGAVKRELEHVEEECSRKRGRTASCSKPGTKACREKLRREKLNDKFMELSSFLEPGRTPKTDKSGIVDDGIRVVNQLRGEVNELRETNQKLQEEIKSLKAEKNELREEKLVLKADKEKIEQQLKSIALPSPSFMPAQHPAAFHQHKMAVYPSFGYYPNMPMWPSLHPVDRDTSHDHRNWPHAA